MTTKMVRLTTEAEEIAKRYGHTVSAGIVNMSKQIHPVETLMVDNTVAATTKGPISKASATYCWIKKSQLAADGGLRLGDVSEDVFWKRMKAELDGVIQSYSGR